MRIIRYTHACVRLERDGRVLVIDPGIWSEPHALVGADAVLVTHEHSDHVDRFRLAGLGVPVYAPAGAAIAQLDVVAVRPGGEFSTAGFTVRATGGRHAYSYGRQPGCPNLGYVVDGQLYHPGDSLHVPQEPIDTLLVPMQASWLKTSEAIDFVRAIGPRAAYGIHDGQLNERGVDGVNSLLTRSTGGCYRWLAPGQTA